MLLLSTGSHLTRLHVVLVRTRNPLNIGAAARAMSNFGFSSLRLVKAYEPSFREARSAVGASTLLANAEEFPSVADAVADCSLVVGTTAARARQLQHPLKRLEQASPIIQQQLASGRVAFLFGSEKTGLSNKEMSHCHWLMRIPTRENHGAMNLGQAVAVCLYEIVRETKVEPEPATELTSSAALDRLTASLCEALRISGYFAPAAGAVAEQNIRRLVYRLKLPINDAEVWLGLLRQILWKLKNPE
jgi:TrmH family RNA methyltransferase